MSGQTKRIDRGRGHSYYLDGVGSKGVTTALKEGYPHPAFAISAAKKTAGYAIDHWDELQTVGIAERLRRLQRAQFEQLDAAANRGTEVHRLVHEHSLGEEIIVPEALEGHFDAYELFVEEWQPKELLTEVVVVNRRWQYMGTLDIVAELADGDIWLLDLKTNQSGVYAESALQLAGYRFCETYIGADAVEHPMPVVARCGVVWLRADGYDLIPIKAEEAEHRLFLYALEIARWREVNDDWQDRDKCEVIGDALRPPLRVVS